MDVGGVMALCLMYLTDTESAVEQATNASLTKLLRLQTQLVTGTFCYELTVSRKFIIDISVGVIQDIHGQSNPFDEKGSKSTDTIQVSIFTS